MRLESLGVTNFRSIINTEEIALNDKTIIVGKNNEGKSNYLKALNIALTILLEPMHAKYIISRYYRRFPRMESNLFDWERDYPIKNQAKTKIAPSIFVLKFILNNDDLSRLKSITGLNLTEYLIVEIKITQNNLDMTIYKYNKKRIQIKKQVDKIIEFINSNIKYIYIPAIRTEKSSMDIISSLIDDNLRELKSDSQYQNIISMISKLVNQLMNHISKNLYESAKRFIPDLKNIELKTEENDINLFRGKLGYQILVDDGIPTLLNYKGEGIKSLLTLALLSGKQNSSNCIIAIEEPEAHLHSGAMHELKDIIDNLSKNNQILVTTHNPIFIDRYNISNNILVDNGKIKKIKSIKQLRNILGIKLSDNLASCEKVIVVEGESDIIVLKHILALCNNDIIKLITHGNVVFQNAGGASKIEQQVRFYKNVLCDVMVVIDNDSKQIINDLIKEKILEPSDIFMIDNTKTVSELEDMYAPKVSVEFFKHEYNIDFKEDIFKNEKKKWSDIIKNEYSNRGYPFNEEIEKEIKVRFSKFVTEHYKDTSIIKQKDLNILMELASRICSKV